MDPFTILALGSTALTALGKVAGGAIGSQIDEFQAQISRGNTALLLQKAQTERTQAGLATAQGGLEESRTREQLDRVYGGETAHFAASNLDPTYGSPLLLQGFSAAQGQVDINLIHARAAAGVASAYARAAGTQADAASSAGRTLGLELKSSQDMIAGLFGAGSTLLQGASKAWAGLPGGGGDLRGGIGLPAGDATGGLY